MNDTLLEANHIDRSCPPTLTPARVHSPAQSRSVESGGCRSAATQKQLHWVKVKQFPSVVVHRENAHPGFKKEVLTGLIMAERLWSAPGSQSSRTITPPHAAPKSKLIRDDPSLLSPHWQRAQGYRCTQWYSVCTALSLLKTQHTECRTSALAKMQYVYFWITLLKLWNVGLIV